jgi:hypothetical protein
MLKLTNPDLFMVGTLCQIPLSIHAIDRDSEEIGVILEKIDIVLVEMARFARVNLKHPKWLIIAADHDVHGALDAVLPQELGYVEPVFGVDVL